MVYVYILRLESVCYTTADTTFIVHARNNLDMVKIKRICH